MLWRRVLGYLVTVTGLALFIAGWTTELLIPWTKLVPWSDSRATPIAPLAVFVVAVACSRLGRALAERTGWLARPLPASALWVVLMAAPAPEGHLAHWYYARFFVALLVCVQLIAAGFGMSTGRSAASRSFTNPH